MEHGGGNQIYGPLDHTKHWLIAECEVLDNFRGLCGPRTRTFFEDNNIAVSVRLHEPWSVQRYTPEIRGARTALPCVQRHFNHWQYRDVPVSRYLTWRFIIVTPNGPDAVHHYFKSRIASLSQRVRATIYSRTRDQLQLVSCFCLFFGQMQLLKVCLSTCFLKQYSISTHPPTHSLRLHVYSIIPQIAISPDTSY